MSDHPRTTAEAAAELGVSYGWLKKQVSGRQVPFHAMGRKVVFYDDDITAIKDQTRQAPRTTVPRIAGGRRVA